MCPPVSESLHTVNIGANIVSIAAGAEHCLAANAAGQLFSWGCGSNGRLGHAQSSSRLWFWNKDESYPRLVQSVTEKVAGISCGHMHSGALHGSWYRALCEEQIVCQSYQACMTETVQLQIQCPLSAKRPAKHGSSTVKV